MAKYFLGMVAMLALALCVALVFVVYEQQQTNQQLASLSIITQAFDTNDSEIVQQDEATHLPPDQYIFADEFAGSVTRWNQLFLHTIAGERMSPPQAARFLAIAHRAIDDAVDDVPPGLAPSLTVDLVAEYIYHQQFPHRSGMTLVREGPPSVMIKHRDYALPIAQTHWQERLGDGSSDIVTYDIVEKPGRWRATPPYYEDPLLPQWGNVRLFAASASDIALSPPPAITSQAYADEWQEVKTVGGVTSDVRTPQQDEIAKYWADGKGTHTPPGHWNLIAQNVLLEQRRSTAEEAHIYAVLNTALADAGIAAWQHKFSYNYWRPIDAIHHANSDDNPDTSQDLEWMNYIEAPNFPEYPSGHSAFSGAGATVLAQYFGDDTSFSSHSLGLPGVSREFTSFSQAAQEAGMSRIYGGIHFQSANVEGLSLGRAVAHAALRQADQPR